MSGPRPASVATRPYPSIPAIIFTIWALAVPVAFSARMLNADGDPLRHLRHGEWMLQHHALIRADPFSFSRGGAPFVAFEYGSQLIYALAHRLGGLAAVAILAGLLIASSYAVLARFLLSRGADPLLTYLVSVAAAILGAAHWTPRPHLFTLLAVTILLFFLEHGARRPPLWLLAPLFALWANLHGGFIYGLILLGIYLAGSLGEWRWGDDPVHWRERARYYALALAIAATATLATPLGIAVHRHIIAFLGDPFIQDNTHEFLSPDFHTAGGKMLLVSLLAILSLLSLVPGRLSLPRLLLLLVNVAFALQSRRNAQLYAATVFPALALHFDAAWRRLPDWRGVRLVFERDARRGRGGLFVGGVAVLMSLLAAAHGRIGRWEVVTDRLDPRQFPIAAVRQARTDRLEGRIFHEFTWGGYLLYAWPEQKVFIDGGADFYGKEIIQSYLAVTSLEPGWREQLDRWKISLILLPPYSPVMGELARSGAWSVYFCDPTAALLQRAPADAVQATAKLERCLRPADLR